MQAEASTSFPLLRKVLVSFGNNVAFEDTLEEALDTLFAEQGGNPRRRRRHDHAAARRVAAPARRTTPR